MKYKIMVYIFSITSCILYNDYYVSYYPIDINDGTCNNIPNVPLSFNHSAIQETTRQKVTATPKSSNKVKREQPKYIDVD